MQPADAISQINESADPAVLAPHWADTLAAGDGRLPDFLQPETIAELRRAAGLPPAADTPLVETARRIAGDPALRLLARHCYRLLYAHADYNRFGAWPSFQTVLGENAGVFYLLILLAAAPFIRAQQRRRNIPEEITRATCDRRDAVERYRATHQGRWGADRRSLYWTRFYTNGDLYRLGRMEYMLRGFKGLVEVYRHARTGATVAFAPDGAMYDAQGLAVKSADGVNPPPGTWTASLTIAGGWIQGCPILPEGVAVRRQIRLPAQAWRRALGKDDWTMDMHIPAGGGMTLELCGASMRQAADFFPRYFPDRPTSSITCASWIFNTQLDGIFTPETNLVRFQHELYLYPVPSTGRDGLVFIFGQDDPRPDTAPRGTRLQRAILDFLAAGNRWRNGGMFFLAADLPHFGQGWYRGAGRAAELNLLKFSK